MLKRLATVAISGAFLIGTVAGVAPATLAAPESGVETPVDVAASVEAPVAAPAPSITSATATLDSVAVAWTWGDEATAPEGVTGVVVRVSPGDHEVEVESTAVAATVTELDPATDYTIELLSSFDGILGDPSEPFEVSTLSEFDTGSDVVDAASSKPMATSGDVTSLIVTLKSEAAPAAQAEAATDDLALSGVDVEETKELGATNVRVDLTEGVSDADAAVLIADIEDDPTVESVMVNERVFRTAFPTDPPDDTYWANDSLWGLYGPYGIGIASNKTSMGTPWTSGQGEGVVVAVLDTGSTVHPDLDANYVAGYDFVDNGTGYCRSGISDSDGDYINTGTYGALGWDNNPLDPGDWTTVTSPSCGSASNSSWHGTHVAGTVAAVGNNSIGVIGVAPQAKIQPVRVLSYDGGYTSDIVAGITWASGGTVSGVPANATPADVINLSLGGVGSCTTSWQTAIDAAVARGATVVVSAGNSNADASTFVPANCNNVITVASTTSSGNRSSFSNYGTDVDIAAPGSGIWSTLNSGTTTPASPTYASYNGTSMAAPHVSGVAALISLTYPNLTPAQILSRIQSNVSAFPGGSTCTTSICGSGLLNATAAVTSEPIPTSMTPDDGATAGGDSVTIAGYNLTGATVAFGGTAAASTVVTSAYQLTSVTQAASAGAVTVAVTNGSGTRSLSTSFTFHDPPTLSSLTPTSGTTAGGTSVTLTGTNLSGTSAVTFGGTAATVISASSTTTVVSTPAHSAGLVDVVVTTPGGSSTLTNAFTYATPVVSSPPSSGGGGGSSSSSSSESSTGGGGGGLNEITTISPSASGPPGSVIALAGWGLATTRSVTFNEYEASWRVVSDSHVEVTVPNIPSGVYVIHAVLAPEVGRASYWAGYHVLAPTVGSAPPAATPAPGTTPPGASTSASAAEIVAFKPNSAALLPATKARLTRMVKGMTGADVTGTVVAFSDLRGTATSKKVARQRAKAVTSFLESLGVTGDLTTTIDKGATSTLRKGVIVRLSTEPAAGASTPGEKITSLIVRYAKGVSPTVDGKVRGSALVTGGLGTGMTLGPNLGLRMYRVDFAQPVTLAQADKAAAQMTKDKGVQFAEPDRLVSATVTKS